MVFPKVRNTSSKNSCNQITTIIITCSPVRLMSLPAILVGIIVLITVAPLYAQPLTPGVNSQNFEFKRYCSDSLSEAILQICGGHINSISTEHKDSSGSIYSSNLKHLSDDGIIILRTGIINECCSRPCGYSELKMYCGPV